MDKEGRLLGSKEVAERLGVSQSRVRQLAIDKLIPATKLARDWFIRESDLVTYESERRRRGRPRKERPDA